MAYRFDCTETSGRRRGVDRAVVSVNSGALVVFPVDSAYGLGCDAFSPEAVDRLRAAKGHTRRQPPPVMIGHARTLDGIANQVSDEARELVAAFWPGPLTLLCHAQPTLNWDLGDTGGTVAVRMPLHPLALELLTLTGPMAVTGAGAPGASGSGAQPQSCHEVRETFEDQVEVYLDGGVLTRPHASTIVDVTGEAPRLLRPGAIDLEALRVVVPDLLGIDG